MMPATVARFGTRRLPPLGFGGSSGSSGSIASHSSSLTSSFVMAKRVASAGYGFATHSKGLLAPRRLAHMETRGLLSPTQQLREGIVLRSPLYVC